MGHDHNPDIRDHNKLSEQDQLEFDAALARVLAGDATPNDLTLIDDRRGMGGVWTSLPHSIESATGNLAHLPQPLGFDAGVRWQRFKARISTVPGEFFDHQNTIRSDRHTLVSRFHWVRSTVLSVSVALAALIVGYFGIFSNQEATTSGSPPTVIATRNSQQTTVTLLDGTVVTLNVASRLEIPKDFNAGNRTVRLDGEAMFSVTHRSGNAFTVIAGGTPTRVLGTTFSVRKYGSDNNVTVAVRDGKVSVRSVVLTENQQAEIGMDDTVWVHASNPGQFGFATGVLHLDGIPLLQAITELNRWYDADIRLGDSLLAHKNIKASFSAGSISDMAEVLGLVFDARVVVNGKKVVLYSKE